MHKLKSIVVGIFGLAASLAITGHVYAGNVSVRVAQPKSPTNQNNFDLKFVAMDLLGRSITVKCFKQGPSDGSFVQFGGDQSLQAGGNSGACNTGSGVFSDQGTYSFKVDAYAGGDSAEDTTSVVYDTSGPGDLKDYSKSLSACQYTIHFKTAADSGATAYVELYRSDAVPFIADHNSRIQSITIGSDTPKDTTDTPPDCNKTWYYAVRAFDSAGNGSALIGDNVNNTTVITPTPGASSGAIPVTNTNGNVLGEQTGATGSSGAQGQVEGTSSQSAEVVTITPIPKQNMLTAHPKRTAAIVIGILVILGALAYVFWSRKKS